MKLRPELVPKPLYGINACQLLSAPEWRSIRRDALIAAGQRCSVCRAGGGGLICHEHWDYRDEARTATLATLVIHCPACDTATHMGRAVQHGRKEAAIARLCLVNGCDPTEAEKVFHDAMSVWRERSGKDWTMLVSDALLTRYPALSVLHRRHVVNRLRPSEERGAFFLRAYALGTNDSVHREHGGKWLILVPRTDVDAVWLRIREALEAGRLGDCAKVSTARPNRNAPDPLMHVICVYTNNSDDVDDVKRVRASLRELKLLDGLRYKTNAATQ